jgi:hypothetical protein
MPNIPSPDLLHKKTLTKLTANGLYQSAYPFAKLQLRCHKLRRLPILGWHRKLKSLFGKEFGSQRLGQICPVSKQQTTVAGGQFRQHSYIVDVRRCDIEALNHSNRIGLQMQTKTIKSLIAKFFAVCSNALKKFAKPRSGEPAYRHRETIKHKDNIFETFGNIFEQPLFYPPEIGRLSYKINPAGQIREVMPVEIFEEIEDFFVGVKSKNFTDNFNGKYFAVSQLRQRTSGSKCSVWEEIFHKIISLAEDIYDKIIKIHFLALYSQWNYFVEDIFNSIGQRAFLISVHSQKLVHGVNN